MLHLILTKERFLVWISIVSLIVITVLYFITGYRCAETSLSSKYEIKNNDRARRAFIESFQIRLKDTPSIKDTVILPETMDGVYADYEKIQNEMGLSLVPFQGKKVQKYTYEVEDPDNTLYANLLIYDNYVIACDVLNPDFRSGFIRSFANYSPYSN